MRTAKLAAMSGDAENLHSKIDGAVADGQLMESAEKNILNLLAGSPSDFYLQVVGELVAADAWPELNDRFYQTLVFGTVGLRGRMIGKIVTAAERGSSRKDERPKFPCGGANARTFFNISRTSERVVDYLL